MTHRICTALLAAIGLLVLSTGPAWAHDERASQFPQKSSAAAASTPAASTVAANASELANANNRAVIITPPRTAGTRGGQRTVRPAGTTHPPKAVKPHAGAGYATVLVLPTWSTCRGFHR